MLWSSHPKSFPFQNFYKRYNFPIVSFFRQVFFLLILQIAPLYLKFVNVFVFQQIFVEQKPHAGTLSSRDTNKTAPWKAQREVITPGCIF